MKLAIVHDWLTGMRGGEKCLEVLCRRFPDATLFTLLHKRGSVSAAIERMEIRTSFLQRVLGIGRHYRWWLPLMPAAIEAIRIPNDVDLVLSFSHAVAKSVRPPAGVPHVCYCFTPMRYAWHRRADYLAAGGARAAVARPLLDWLRRWDRATSRRVTHYVAISRTVAERIRECYGRTSRVIYPPVDTAFYTPGSGPREDFYLCVSALVPYKRIDLAVEACKRLGRRLVVIGSGPQRRPLSRLAGSNVKLLGWQSDEVVRDYFRRARAVLFPAHEDFGIVPLEAQACGTPVIAYGRGGATETVIEGRPGTGLFFRPQTADALARAIRRFESEPGSCCPGRARRQAERFAAERFERELVGYLQSVHQAAGQHGRPFRGSGLPSQRPTPSRQKAGRIALGGLRRMG